MPLSTHKTGINHPIIHHPSATVYLIINLLCIGDGLFWVSLIVIDQNVRLREKWICLLVSVLTGLLFPGIEIWRP